MYQFSFGGAYFPPASVIQQFSILVVISAESVAAVMVSFLALTAISVLPFVTGGSRCFILREFQIICPSLLQ